MTTLATRLTTARWHIARLPSRLASLLERVPWSYSSLSRTLRTVPTILVGITASAALTWDVPLWMRLALLASALCFAFVHVKALYLRDEMLASKLAATHQWRAFAQMLLQRNHRLHAELDARADDVAAYDAQCLDAEHKLVATWDRAAENLRLAMHWRFVAESNAKRAEHWEYIAKQNAAGYEQMSGVVMTHLRDIGGEEAVAAVANDLEAFERSQN